MKGSTLYAKLDSLGITPSHSRPRVSNDNAYSESLFRTCKYHPRFPTNGFNQIEDARQWVHHFVRWYNEEHRHSQIRYVTPAQRHAGQDEDILRARHELYQQAQRANPARWSGQTRNWQPIGEVWLNPDKNLKIIQQEKTLEAA